MIFGSGIAGVNAATALKQSEGMDVILFQNEDYLPYYRMRLEEVVKGAAPDTIFIHDLDWYEKKGIELVKGEIEKVDSKNKCVYLKDGEKYVYDYLIVATGAVANRLNLEGGGKEYNLRNMKDALALKEELESGKRNIVISGGGLLGIELGRAICEAYDTEVTILESADYILPKQFDPSSSAWLEEYLRTKGIIFKTGVKAESNKNGVIQLDNGEEIFSDLFISSIGVHPDIDVLKASGFSVNRGLVVNEYLETSEKNVYAAGDVAEFKGKCASVSMYAREMALHIVSEIKEGNREYVPSYSSSVLKIAGLSVTFLGDNSGSPYTIKEGDERVTLFEKDGILSGAILINAQKYLAKVKGAMDKPFDKNILEAL